MTLTQANDSHSSRIFKHNFKGFIVNQSWIVRTNKPILIRRINAIGLGRSEAKRVEGLASLNWTRKLTTFIIVDGNFTFWNWINIFHVSHHYYICALPVSQGCGKFLTICDGFFSIFFRHLRITEWTHNKSGKMQLTTRKTFEITLKWFHAGQKLN